MTMRQGMELSQRQIQTLRLTTQMIQSMSLLQLPLMTLREQIDQELTENPVLEMEEPSEPAEAAEAPAEEDGAEAAQEPPDELSRDWDDYFREPGRRASSEAGDRKMQALLNTAAPSDTLQDYLSGQLPFVDAPEPIKELAESIIYNIDDNGYLQHPLQEIVESLAESGSVYTPDQAQEALRLVQGLEPPGMGARSVEECLLLQMARIPGDHEFEERLVREHFEDLLNNRLPQIAKAMGTTIERIKEALALIGTLSPHPGATFSNESPQYIVPDVVVERSDGDYAVKVNETYIPNLGISQYYRDLLKTEKRDPKTRDYIRQKIQSAKWLIEAIEQRRHTLRRVAEAIVKAQREFFEKGMDGFKPLLMQQIADGVGVHVSTVCRAVADKYMQTPHGIFPMKYFFSGGYRSTEGEAESNRVVMQRIKDMIGAEEKHSPLSDEEIVERLQAAGLRIARRTVAKYRDKLGIPSSRQRRQY